MKLVCEYLLWIKTNVDVRLSIMRVAYTKTIFCLDLGVLLGVLLRGREGNGGQEREGKGRRRVSGGQGRGVEGPLRLRIPGSIFTQVRRCL